MVGLNMEAKKYSIMLKDPDNDVSNFLEQSKHSVVGDLDADAFAQ